MTPQHRAALWLLLAILSWAGNALVARALAGSVPPMAMSFWRWAGAFLILIPLTAPLLWRERARLRQGGWRLVVLGVLGISTFNTILYHAAVSTTAINITLVNTTLPVAVFALSGWLLNSWPTRRNVLGTLVALLGLLWLISAGSWQRLWALQFNQGDVLMLLAVLDWGLYSVLLKRWAAHLQGFSPMLLLAALVLIGAPPLLPLYWWEWQQVGGFALTVGNLAGIAYTAVFASLLAYFGWNQGVRVLGANTAAVFNYLMPVFTAVLAVWLLDEQVTWAHACGGGLILFGLWWGQRSAAH
nr:DMT family transporter [Atopomonas sediminilitoris]